MHSTDGFLEIPFNLGVLRLSQRYTYLIHIRIT